MKVFDGGALAAKGYRAAAVSAGIKSKPGALDVGIIVSDLPATAAGCFTTNRVCSAAVTWSRAVARRGKARAVLVNSGNANACTSERGDADARECAARVASLLSLQPFEVFVASTGIIGHPLPMEKMRHGIDAAVAALARSREVDKSMARAIMTTDTVPKARAARVKLSGGAVTVGGIAKGSGMISPKMGTMLSFITTDAAVSAPLLRQTLRDVAKRTFNRLTVDGDTSTNDTLVLLANGAAGAPAITKPGRDLEAFAEGLEAVARSLVEALARDGEGATRLIVVTVSSAKTEAEADVVARTIANSPLVKCAVHGGDPNWGRIVCAAGYSGAAVEPKRMNLRIGGVKVFAAGLPVKAPAKALAKAMGGKEVFINLDLGRGQAQATMWTCDYSRAYIDINADYHT